MSTLKTVVAQAIMNELERQNYGTEFTLPEDLCVDWIDQGTTDMGLVAEAAIKALREYESP